MKTMAATSEDENVERSDGKTAASVPARPMRWIDGVKAAAISGAVQVSFAEGDREQDPALRSQHRTSRKGVGRSSPRRPIHRLVGGWPWD